MQAARTAPGPDRPSWRETEASRSPSGAGAGSAARAGPDASAKTGLRPRDTARKRPAAPACARGQKPVSAAVLFVFFPRPGAPHCDGRDGGARGRSCGAGRGCAAAGGRLRRVGAMPASEGSRCPAGRTGRSRQSGPGSAAAPTTDDPRCPSSRSAAGRAPRGTPARSTPRGGRSSSPPGGRDAGQGLRSCPWHRPLQSRVAPRPRGGPPASPPGRQQGARGSLSAGVPERHRYGQKTRGSRPGAEPARAVQSASSPAPASVSFVSRKDKPKCHARPRRPGGPGHGVNRTGWARCLEPCRDRTIVACRVRSSVGDAPAAGTSATTRREASFFPVHSASVPDAWTATG